MILCAAEKFAVEKLAIEIVAAYERFKPLKTLPTPNVPNEPWPHGCAIEPCPTCAWHARLKGVATDAPWRP